jgi:ferric-dicitrate binding protein FerR (iron transport regulator)
MPARDAMRALSRWYDLDIELGDSSLAAVPFTASFGDEPIAEVLHIVAITLDAVVEHHGRSVVLVGRHPVLPPS